MSEVQAADPGLAQLEEGFARWQALHVERDRLDLIVDELRARAEQAVAPMLPPEPPIPPELEPYAHENSKLGRIVWWGTVPRKGKVGKIADAHGRAEIEWRGAQNKLLDEQPDYQRADKIEDKRQELANEADEVRETVLAIPTTSPQGLLIKLAIAVEAKTLDEIEGRIANADEWGLHDGWVSEGLLPPLVADLRAMVGSAAT